MSKPSEAIAKAEDFISFREARDILGLTPDQLQRLLKRVPCTTRRIPGRTPQLLRTEVEKIARESIIPARAG